jgi:putative tryptophan/tyrosine transport system substrate-binding protein
MKRRVFLNTAALWLAAPLGAEAEQAGRIWRVGILNPNPYPSPEVIARSIFLAGMRKLGYVEGQNVVYERRFTGEKLELFAPFAAELVTAKVDLILAIGSPATRAAKEATATIPIVFGEVSQPVRQGFVASLTRPGANVTGVADVSV